MKSTTIIEGRGNGGKEKREITNPRVERAVTKIIQKRERMAEGEPVSYNMRKAVDGRARPYVLQFCRLKATRTEASIPFLHMLLEIKSVPLLFENQKLLQVPDA